MGLTNEHVGSKKPAKINAYILTRAELLITLCHEIPCILLGQIMEGKKAWMSIEGNEKAWEGMENRFWMENHGILKFH